MNGRVWAQRPVKKLIGTELECGWISGNDSYRVPKKVSDVKLTLDVEKSLRFDVDNNAFLLNSMIEAGYTITVCGSIIIKKEQGPSVSPFSPIV